MAQEIPLQEIVIDSAGATTTAQSGNGLTAGPSHVTPNVLISMVRGQVRAVDEYSYTPHYVPIGPYHYVSCSSTRIEMKKENAFSHLRDFSMKNQSVADGALQGLEIVLTPLVRKCYPDCMVEAMKPEDQLKLSTMSLLRDGCYVLCVVVDYRRVNAHNGDPQGSSRALSNNTTAGSDNGDPQGSSSGALSNNTTAGSHNGDPQGSSSGALSNNTTAGSNNGDPQGSSGALGNNTTAVSTQTTARAQENSTGDSVAVRDTVFLVENQIPFFVLQMIHEVVLGDATNCPLEHEAAGFVQEVLQGHLYISKYPLRRPDPDEPPLHLLDLLHGYLKPTRLPDQATGEDPERERTGRWRRATEYCKYSNVRFKRREFRGDEEWTVLDVKHEDGILWIPQLHVDDTTWTILRNLMALEEEESNKPVTAYCVFMSQVACKAEDVELLRRKRILKHFLANDKEVAQGLGNLCKGVFFEVDDYQSNYLKPIWHELHELNDYRHNYCMGSFRQIHWSDPMVRSALIFSIILFLLQTAQVILGLIPLVPKHKT